MPTLIYNSNNYVKWDKTECDNYTITSLIDYSILDVTITDLTPASAQSPWTETFVLEPGANNSIVLPGDGVFQICATARTALPANTCQMTTLNYVQSVINIGQLDSDPDADEAQLWMVAMANGGTIYQNVNYGGADPNAHFGTPPTSYQPAITVIQNWLTANGGGVVEIVQPGATPVNAPWVAVDNEDYQLIILHPTDSVITVVTAQSEFVRPVFHYPDIDCVTIWVGNGCNRDWLVSLTIDGVEILDRPYNNTDPDDAELAAERIRLWLSQNGGGQVINDPEAGLFVVFENCVQSAIATLGDLVPSPTECNYIYEFCDLYSCISRLMNRWMCPDPCTQDPCSKDNMTYQEARQKAIELSTMFFHALMPLVSQERLWHLGNWDVSIDRTCDVNNILDLYKRLRDYVKSCGFDCGPKCKPCEPCGPCADGNRSYSSTSPNPCSSCK
jgi:hypothetical protein